MTDYVKSTNFASKDTLASGNPLKIVKGTEIDTEFNNIATAVATKADLNSPTLVTPNIGTPSAGVLTNATGLPLTTGVTGTLLVTNGGTGAATLTGLVYGNGTTAMTAATSTQVTSSITDGTLPGSKLVDASVTTAKLANANVTSAKLASGAAVSNIGYTPANQADFTGSNQSLSTNGYQKLPGGLIMQWGTTTFSSSTSITFPTAFPTACLAISGNGISGSNPILSFNSVTRTGVTAISNTAGSLTYNWIALGY